MPSYSDDRAIDNRLHRSINIKTILTVVAGWVIWLTVFDRAMLVFIKNTKSVFVVEIKVSIIAEISAGHTTIAILLWAYPWADEHISPERDPLRLQIAKNLNEVKQSLPLVTQIRWLATTRHIKFTQQLIKYSGNFNHEKVNVVRWLLFDAALWSISKSS